MSRAPILPGALSADGRLPTLGVMGGGQLGRMFIHAAQQMGYYTAVLDPDPSSPAGLAAHYHIQTDYLNEQGLAQLMQRCAAITTEFENVPSAALLTLGAQRQVAPDAHAVAICQHRADEKALLQAAGIGVAPHARIEAPGDVAAVDAGLFPGILKTSRLGYDGKGQVTVERAADLAAAWDELHGVPCVLERRLLLMAEISVIVARDADGTTVHLPVQRNLHRRGVLAVTEVPAAGIDADLQARAVAAAQAVAHELRYVGVLCVEFFIVQGTDGRAELLANEMAPRPHNSGHYSIDACDVSQFELQVRTLAGLPLVAPRLHSPAVMLNLLGDLWFDGGAPRTPPWAAALALPGVHLHLYGKLAAKPGRKMGHLTVTAATAAEAHQVASQVARLLGIEPFQPHHDDRCPA